MMTADEVYGRIPGSEPTGAAGPEPDGRGERTARTETPPSMDGKADPIAWLVMFIGAAIAFGWLSFRLNVG